MKRYTTVIAAALAWASLAGAAIHEVPGSYPTIQAAVNAAAAGDTVRVAPGTFEEQVVVTGDLVLLGAGRDLTTLQAPVSLPHSVGNAEYRPVICVETPAENVTVAGMTVDGLKRQPETGRFAGIVYWQTGGRIADVTMVNLHPHPITDAITGIGFLASRSYLEPPLPMVMEDVTVRRFQKSGIVINGSYHAVLDSVLVATDGVYSDVIQNGVELSFLYSARVTDCEIYDITYDGSPFPELTASGLLVYFVPDAVITDCRLIECQAGTYMLGSEGALSGLVTMAPPSAATYCHGLVAVDWLPPGGRLAGQLLPMPRPTIDEGNPPGRPQNTWRLQVGDSVFAGGGLPSSRGLAVGSFGADALDLVVERCTLKGWETGVIALEDGLSAVYGRVSGCRFMGNQSYGAYANTLSPIDARGSWWGDATGPYHPLTNPFGLGDTASDHVLFDPWLAGNLAPLPVPQIISLADHDGVAYTDTINVEYLGGAAADLYAYSALLEWDPAVIRSVSVERPARGAFAEAIAFETVADGDHRILVDAAIGGARPGILSGPLFTARFEAVGTPDYVLSPLTLTLVHARDSQNQPVDGFVTDAGSFTVDLQPPVVHGITVRNESLDHTDAFAKDGDLLSMSAIVTDGDPAFDRGSIRGIPAGLWNSPYLYMAPDAYVAPQAFWSSRPAWLTPADGPVTVFVEGRDPSGNFSVLVTDTITADNTLPATVTGFTASPDHNQAHLSWDDATTTDLNYRRTVVRAYRQGDYPFYDAPHPGYPAGVEDGEAVYSGDGDAVDPAYPADGSERDIFSFSVMVEDLAGNVSAVDGGSRARATNYRLGDVRGHPTGSPGDGIIDIYDMTRLGDTYGLLRAEAGFDGDCDVGPANGGSTGTPVPDEEIEFEDLMIFADQYYVDDAPPAPGGDAVARLVWRQLAPDTWALDLTSPCPRLKGLRLEGDAQGATLTLTAGPLLQAQSSAWFLHPARGGLSAHLAVLGHGAGLVGEGELLRFTATEPQDLPTPTVELRDVDNAPLDSDLPTAVADGDLTPRVFRAGPAHPNPFNPSTRIAFDLPARLHVRLAIHDPAGRLVAVILDTELPAARHAAHWRGRDSHGRPVAAGTYLYRLEAGPWSASGKLQLVK